MDRVISPGRHQRSAVGGLGVLNLEGLWTRYEDPEPYLEERSRPPRRGESRTRRMQEIYAEPI
ncbi:MAG: hypothetical protein R2749_11435 [Acidimicrobiales bacterium]